MTSSNKKKKKKRADFQKVKLKAGRRLPKGLNVTNTTFKTRKIQIREQIRDDIAAASFQQDKKVLTIDDILRNLHHPNSTSRQNSLTGLKSLFNSNKEAIHKNLNSLLSSISKLVEDKSSDVRKSAQNALELLLSVATSSQISPVFPFLAAYLNCGMTHIEPAIQRDSLKFLDVVLRHFPELLMESNPRLLSNFLEQISRKTTSNANVGRTLLVNPESRLTGQEWRLQVLKRLQKFIAAILSNQQKLKQRSDVGVKSVGWNLNLVYVHVPHPESILHDNFPCNNLSMSSVKFEDGKQNICENSEELKKFMSSLIPLLIETWVEVRPEMMINKNGSILASNSLATLSCLIEIVKLILDCIDSYSLEQRLSLKDFLKNRFEKEFFEYFMVCFPYVASTTNAANKNEKKTKKNLINPQLKGGALKVLGCNLNLMLVYIFVKLHLTSNGNEKNWQSVIKYLISLLQSSEYRAVAYDTKLMHEVLKTISTNNNFKDIGENLLSVALDCYKNENTAMKKKSFLLEFFSNTILNSDQFIVSSPALTEWLSLLPKELLNAKFCSKILSFAKTMATRQNEAFLSGLQMEKSNIIDLLIKTGVNVDSEAFCRGLIELLLHVKLFETNDYRILTSFVRNEVVPINTRCYCISILALRYSKNAENFSETEASSYISFLLSLILVPTIDLQSSTDSFLPLRVKIFDTDTNLCVSNQRILKEVYISINEFENLAQVKDVFLSYFSGLLKSNYNCSLLCAWSIINILNDLEWLDALFESAKDTLAEFLISTIYAELIYEKNGDTVRLVCSNKLIAYKIVSILETLVKGLETEKQATTICILLAKLLQNWSPSKKYLFIIKTIGKHLKQRFAPTLTDSVGWNSLLYELELKLQKPIN